MVIDGLKLIEARLLGLAFVENPREERLPLVKLKGQEERVPLKSLGDGVTRVFHIMLALVNAKDGVLLIDEFENGLHWTVQESVWRVLFQMANRLNVQVFCTTHSRDCIKAFDAVWQEFENEGAFFRLYAHDNEIRVREYDLANFIGLFRDRCGRKVILLCQKHFNSDAPQILLAEDDNDCHVIAALCKNYSLPESFGVLTPVALTIWFSRSCGPC